MIMTCVQLHSEITASVENANGIYWMNRLMFIAATNQTGMNLIWPISKVIE